MAYLLYLLGFIFILGSAVVLHEFGHFLVAKLFKIRVETFSVGFGPRLFGRKWGHTDYRLSAIPLGGYVKLGGDDSNAPLEGASAQDIPPEEMFNLRPRWQRVLVALAGPVMNILTALAIPFAGAFIYGVPATPAPVVYDMQRGGAAELAGLKQGDRFISIGGENVRSSAQVTEYIRSHDAQKIPITVERAGQITQITTNERRINGKLGIAVTEQFPLYPAGVGSAAKYAYDSNLQILRLTGKALGQVFTGQRSVRNTLSGPIGIYQATQKSIEKLGWDGV